MSDFKAKMYKIAISAGSGVELAALPQTI